MDFVLGFDNGYTSHAAALICSVCSNNVGIHEFHVITDHISEENYKKLSDDVDNLGSHLKVYNVSSDIISLFPFHGNMANNYVSIATYFRLLMIEVLPSDIKRIIYLDCDTIVNGSIHEMWDWQFADNHFILAAEDDKNNVLSGPTRLNYPCEYSYFNAGVFMVDLQKMRKELSFMSISSFISDNYSQIKFHDQDILNGLLFDKRDLMPLQFNVLEVYYIKKHYPSKLYSDTQSIIQSPTIIHYSGPIKPWHKECNHPLKKLYFDYLGKTSFRDIVIKAKYDTPMKFVTYRLKCFVKILLELMGLRYYSYIEI